MTRQVSVDGQLVRSLGHASVGDETIEKWMTGGRKRIVDERLRWIHVVGRVTEFIPEMTNATMLQ